MDEYIAGYVAGIIDAEASFSVSVKLQNDLKCTVRLDPVFTITQENIGVLEILQRYLGCGRIIRKPGQKHLWLLIIDNLDDLCNCLVARLDRLTLHAKKRHYQLFREIVCELARKKYRLSCCDVKRLVEAAYRLSEINPKSKRKRALNEILMLIPCRDEAGEPPGER